MLLDKYVFYITPTNVSLSYRSTYSTLALIIVAPLQTSQPIYVYDVSAPPHVTNILLFV